MGRFSQKTKNNAMDSQFSVLLLGGPNLSVHRAARRLMCFLITPKSKTCGD